MIEDFQTAGINMIYDDNRFCNITPVIKKMARVDQEFFLKATFIQKKYGKVCT